ncbi:MAG: hypothetical protein EXR67_01890 [Dehalococcoidia bacterium]|nr:hypothetical protein [Dehalococcoidia bacterium]
MPSTQHVSIEWLDKAAAQLILEFQTRRVVTVPELAGKLYVSEGTTPETQARLIRAYTQQILNRAPCEFEMGSGSRPGQFVARTLLGLGSS